MSSSNEMYIRKGVGNRTYCVTCQKMDDGCLLTFEKKIKIRSKKKIADESKSTTRQVVFNKIIKTQSIGSINHDDIFSSLSPVEKDIFINIIKEMTDGYRNEK